MNLPVTASTIKAQGTISQSTQILEKTYSKTSEPSDDYFKSLAQDQGLLKIAVANPNANYAPAAVQAAANDLALKASFSQIHANSPGVNPSITVKVYTRKNGNTLNDYDVHCNSLLYSYADMNQYPFPNQTSPATRSLPPGFFTLIILKQDREVATQTIELGDDGKTTLDVDVEVP